MEKVDYLEFVKKLDEIENYQEKVNLVNNILNHNITLDLEMATVALAIDDLSDLDVLLNSTVNNFVVDYYMKKSVVFFEMIKNYTFLDLKDEYDVAENYNIQLEEILKLNEFVKRYFSIVNEIYKQKNIKIIQDFSDSLKNLPSVEEVDKMTQDFEKVFSKENENNIKILQDIVTFNDPAMKAIKDTIYETIPQNNIIDQGEEIEKKK